MKFGYTLLAGSSLLALTYATSVFSQQRHWYGDRHQIIIEDAAPPEEFNFDFGFEPDIIVGAYALGFYNPGYGYWDGVEFDQYYYSEGHKGYGHYYRGAPETVHQQYNAQGRSHPNEQQRNYISQRKQQTDKPVEGTTNSTERNYHEQQSASQQKEAQQDSRKVEPNNIKHNNSDTNTKPRAAAPTKAVRAPTEQHKSEGPEKR